MIDRIIPRTMSTQHPDNVHAPFFANSPILEGDDEIKEAFYAFSHIKSKEQLWDFEGKEVDNYVVKKLLTRYENFFSKNKLGKDFYLTLRVPNPECEKNEAKILAETLESIPRSFDIARAFYGEDIAPIFEVAQPMTVNALSLARIKEYYSRIVVSKEDNIILKNDSQIKEWIGHFNPKTINVIPLYEDKEGILNSANITEEYFKIMNNHGYDFDYQRVWLARSDPALNYGSLSAILMNKIALQRLQDLQEKTSIEILPILGTGSAPFRGNLRPDNSNNILKAYPSVQTFTIQSAFKYDYPEHQVFDSVSSLEDSKRGKATIINEEKSIEIINKVSEQYQKEITLLSDFINNFSSLIPARRKRKLHIGLFGYSRSMQGITLPRAITFAATLYSIGLPPEMLGISVLDNKDLEYLYSVMNSFEEDMSDSLKYLNIDNLKYFPEGIQENIKKVATMFEHETNYKHKKITSIILEDFKNKNFTVLNENVIRAGAIRGFLG